MEQIARIYSDALFGVAKQADKLDAMREQLGQFADALDKSRELQVFLFSPYFSSAEKRDGIGRAISRGEPELVNFLELLAEKHRMPAIFRIRRRFDELWAEENKRLEVRVTSAVPLDESVTKHVGEQIERKTNMQIDLSSEVDPEILGGIVLQVGDKVLDASVRAKLERLRKEVAAAT